MNILILSVGTRNKIIHYFKDVLADFGKVIATDMSPYAPALYEADNYYIVPSIADPNYIEIILDICQKECITGVLSLIDPELSLLAKNEMRFNEIGTTVIGSSYELCELALNKMDMFHWLADHKYHCAKSYVDKTAFYADLDAGVIDFPIFVKPICGSASLSVNKVYDKETLEFLLACDSKLMIQEYIDGQEIGADVYIDIISGDVVSIFTKNKLLMRAGETDKAVSFKDKKLFDLIEQFVSECGFRGQIDVDMFEVDGKYYISEVNPRFGGGYPHAHECGVDHMKLIANNLNGISNEKHIGDYEDNVIMMKYNEVKVFHNA